MVKAIQMYEANDGSTHRTQTDALCADLAHLFKQCGGINDASAAQLVAKLKGDAAYRDELAISIQMLAEAMPGAVEAAL